MRKVIIWFIICLILSFYARWANFVVPQLNQPGPSSGQVAGFHTNNPK